MHTADEPVTFYTGAPLATASGKGVMSFFVLSHIPNYLICLSNRLPTLHTVDS